MKSLTTPRLRYPLSVDDPRKGIKYQDLRAFAWNVRSLKWEGALARLVDVLVRKKADITAVQEVRWTGQARKRVGYCDVYYSGHIKESKFGAGFVVREGLRRRPTNRTIQTWHQLLCRIWTDESMPDN